jgi:hypothetical protein
MSFCGSSSTELSMSTPTMRDVAWSPARTVAALSYAASPGEVIYRTRTASLDEPEPDRMADDLRQFPELLERCLTRFVTNGKPGGPQLPSQHAEARSSRTVQRFRASGPALPCPARKY